jgi:hypothetical protein
MRHHNIKRDTQITIELSGWQSDLTRMKNLGDDYIPSLGDHVNLVPELFLKTQHKFEFLGEVNGQATQES